MKQEGCKSVMHKEEIVGNRDFESVFGQFPPRKKHEGAMQTVPMTY